MSEKQNQKNEAMFEYREQTLIGTRQKTYIDAETGQKIIVDQVSKRRYGQKHFWKCYLYDFLAVLGIVDSKQLDVIVYVLSNTHPSTNTFTGTYKKIAKNSNCCEKTVATIMKKMQDFDLIRKGDVTGIWLVNPNLIMKGNDAKRKNLLISYEEAAEYNKNSTVEKEYKYDLETGELLPTIVSDILKDDIQANEDEMKHLASMS